MSEHKGKLLIVEDDPGIVQGLVLNLRLEGFDPAAVPTGEEALAADLSCVRLILLDIGLPKTSGLEVLSALRGRGDETPVIVLSARQNESDKVAALRLGADDYVTKPFGVAELLARIDSVLRRSSRAVSAADSETDTEPLTFSVVSIDVEGRSVTRRGKPVPLTHLEFELLLHLVRNPARVLSRRDLLSAVWGLSHAGSPRTVDNFIGQLRTKLERDPENPRHIVTVRGSGYRFDP